MALRSFGYAQDRRAQGERDGVENILIFPFVVSLSNHENGFV
jgi:hypothetical protein